MNAIAALLADESGATVVEYALASALFGTLMVAVLALIASQCGVRLSTTGAGLAALGTSPP